MISKSNSLRLGVVIPIANEAEQLANFLSVVMVQLGKDDRVFCVIDQVSTDNSLQIARNFAVSETRLHVVWAPENTCVVDAYFRGYREAFEAGCEWILEMDGGFSHNPAQIPRFIKAMGSGVEFAAGSRFINGGSHSGQLSRMLLSRGGSLLARSLLGTGMKDMTSGFECFSHDAMAQLLATGVRSRGHFFQTEIRYLMSQRNWEEIPIDYTNPSNGVGTATVVESLQLLGILFWQRLRGR